MNTLHIFLDMVQRKLQRDESICSGRIFSIGVNELLGCKRIGMENEPHVTKMSAQYVAMEFGSIPEFYHSFTVSVP